MPYRYVASHMQCAYVCRAVVVTVPMYRSRSSASLRKVASYGRACSLRMRVWRYTREYVALLISKQVRSKATQVTLNILLSLYDPHSVGYRCALFIAIRRAFRGSAIVSRLLCFDGYICRERSKPAYTHWLRLIVDVGEQPLADHRNDLVIH